MWIEIRKLTKRYGPLVALDSCDLGIHRGEVFGLLGPNGAGKTTLIRLLMGFLRPTSGKAWVGGLDTYTQSVQVRQQTAYLPGDVRLFRRMRGNELLEFVAHLRADGDAARAREVARELDLDLDRRVSFMSTGMRQKLALAATWAANAQLIILDEPTSNLDPNVRDTVGNLVREARGQGRTVFFSSHVLPEVEESCDRVAILRQGKMVHVQTIADLRRQHRIFVRLNGALPEVPEPFRDNLTIRHHETGQVTMESPDDLQSLLGWLATLPLEQIRIEPVRLRAIYDRFHGSPSESKSNQGDGMPTGPSPAAAANGSRVS